MSGGVDNDLSNVRTDIAVILEKVRMLPEIDERTRRIEQSQATMREKIAHNEHDILMLQKKSDGWDLANSIGAGVAAVVAAIAAFFQR